MEFKATEIGYYEEYDTVSCGASNADSTDEYHYINFQRASKIGSADDEGIYFEIDDQIQGGYNLISEILIRDNSIKVLFNDGASDIPFNEITVTFDSPASEGLESIIDGLQKVFKGYEHLCK